MILGQLYDLVLWPHPLPWPWSFKVRVWNSFISGMGRPFDNERKDVSHPFMTMRLTCVTMVGGRMYRIVTGVTSDVGVPSTYLVYSYASLFISTRWYFIVTYHYFYLSVFINDYALQLNSYALLSIFTYYYFMVTRKYLYLRVTINTYATLSIFTHYYFTDDPVGLFYQFLRVKWN